MAQETIVKSNNNVALDIEELINEEDSLNHLLEQGHEFNFPALSIDDDMESLGIYEDVLSYFLVPDELDIPTPEKTIGRGIDFKVGIKAIKSAFNIGNSSPLASINHEPIGNIYEQDAPSLIQESLIEIDGIYVSKYADNRILTLRDDEEEFYILTINETVFSPSTCENIQDYDPLYVIALKIADSYLHIAVAVIKNSEKWIFDQVRSLYGKANAIKYFYNMENPRKQQYIIDQLTQRKKYKRYNYQGVRFNKKENQLAYALTKETNPYENQRAIEMMFSDPNPMKHHVEHRLSILTRISPTYEGRKPIVKSSLMNSLYEKFYKMDSVIQQVVDSLVAAEKSQKRGLRFLFVGNPGVGKTAFSKAIADIINIPTEVFPLNGLASTLELEGVESGYDNADSGRIVKAFVAHGSSEILLIFDEIDKMCRQTKEGDPMNVFYSMLDGTLEDRYLGCPISCENTVIIATANSLDKIPDAIQNRFDTIIHFDDYSVDDKVHIAKCYLIPEIIKNYALKENGLSFPDKVIEYIATYYCEDDGVRDLRHRLVQIICRFISDGMENAVEYITQERVDSILSTLICETPALFFHRHRDEYSEPVANEIKRCLTEVRSMTNTLTESSSNDKIREKLEYLLACRNDMGEFKDNFDVKSFSDDLHSRVFGMDSTIREVTLFYYTAILQGTTLNSNLALCGGYGTGKSTIIKSIAEAMDYRFAKISLNGIDDAKELRGVPFSYANSEPGIIIKEVKKATSLKLLIQLDEIDKIANPEIFNVLIDLLDRDFSDNYLGVPISLKKAIFIATANDWERVPAVIQDRFITVNVDGYSRKEKAEIISDYIIPRIEKGFAASKVSVFIKENARKYLLDNYCPSFGVRDAEKALQKLVSSKLLDQTGEIDSTRVIISKEDINNYLGKKPIPRGNFPDKIQPGISKALAVSNGNQGNTFAIETVLLDGEETLEMTGLPKETVTDSVKIAVTCVKKLYPELLHKKQIHVHFGEGSVPKEGSSAGVALFMSIFSAAIGKPLMIRKPYDVAYTGELSLTGGVFAVGGIYEKIQAASDSGCIKVFIPKQNYERLDLDKIKQFSCEVTPISQISQVIEDIYPK